MNKSSLFTIRYDILDIKYGMNGNKLIAFVHREIYANPEYEGLVKRGGHLWLKISKGEMAKRTNMDKKTVKLLMRPDKNKAAEVFIWEPFSSNKSQDNDIHIVRLNYGILHTISPYIYQEEGGNTLRGGKNTLRGGKKYLEVGGKSPDTPLYTITSSIIPSSLPSSTESKIKRKKSDKTTSMDSIKISLTELKDKHMNYCKQQLLEVGCHPSRLDECLSLFFIINEENQESPRILQGKGSWTVWLKGFYREGLKKGKNWDKDAVESNNISVAPGIEATKAQLELEKEYAA